MHTDPSRPARILASISFVLGALVLQGNVFAQANKGVYRLPRPPKNFSPPSITIEEPVYDWDTVVRGEIVKHTFTIKNTGGTPLIIDNVKPQCGCTAVEKPTQPVPPGKATSVTLSVDTKRFKGALKKTAKVHSNATTEPLVLTMQGSVEELFTTDPENPRIEVVRGSAVPSGKLTLRRASSKAAKVVEISTTSTVVKPTLKEIEPGQVYEVDLAVKLEQSKRSYFYENLVAKIAVDDELIDLPVRVTIIVKNRIDISPRSAYFPRKETDTLKTPNAPALTKEVEIKSLGEPDHKFHILDIDNPGKNFTTKLETIEEGRHYKLIVSLPKLPEKQSRTVRDRLAIKTDDPAQPELTLTAMGIFAAPPRASAARSQLKLPTRRPTAKPAASAADGHEGHDH